jgi:hypothetical protein
LNISSVCFVQSIFKSPFINKCLEKFSPALTFPEAVIEGRIGLKTGILVKPSFREGGKNFSGGLYVHYGTSELIISPYVNNYSTNGLFVTYGQRGEVQTRG